MIGKTLGHYRVLEQIGAGGMGVVYRAHDDNLDRDVALKVLPAGTLTDEAARHRFKKEALALSKLNHPNVATVFDFGSENGTDFLVEELIPGLSLDEMLNSAPLPERETINLGSQLCEALTTAHDAGVIHRDLKPANIRVTPDARLKVLDFGLAKVLRKAPVAGERTATASFTETQTVSGTLPYMSPEQLLNETLDARADLWAFGCVLYEMATGQRPFLGSGMGLADAILHRQPRAPSKVNRKISPGLEAIVLKCLEKDAALRYASAGEIAVDLCRLGSGTVTKALAGRRRTLALKLTVALLLIVAVVTGGWALYRRVHGASKIRSIAVLPLANLSGDPNQEYFADGMTEALITNLSKISALKVISRSSIMRYKGTQKSLPEIARELDVDGVVEGSVLRQVDLVRITVQLIDPGSNRNLWADNYDRDLHDVLALQSDVARAIASEIRVKLTPEEQTRAASPRRTDPQAYEAYVRGRSFLGMWPKGAKKAPKYFQEAIDKQPDFAEAYSGLAWSTYLLAYLFDTPDQFLPKAKEAAQRALELNPNLGEAYITLAEYKHSFEWDWAQGEQFLRRAIELDPNSSYAHMTYASLLVAVGRSAEAIREARQAQQLDPAGLLANRMLAFIYMEARQYDDAIIQNQKTLELDPDHGVARWQLAMCYTLQARYPEALAEFKKLGDTSGTHVGYLYAVSGQQAEARKIARELEQLSKREYVDPFDMASLYAGLGDNDKAIEWLERGHRAHDLKMFLLKVDPRFDKMRPDTRFQDLLRRMNFTP